VKAGYSEPLVSDVSLDALTAAPNSIEIVLVLDPPRPVTVNLTVYVPAFLYVCVGFSEELRLVPSPKFHEYDEI
jgi:hypothetical protein